MSLRRSLRSVSWPSLGNFTVRRAFGWAAMAGFYTLILALALASIGTDIMLASVFFSVLLAQFLYLVLPVEKIRAFGRGLMTGEYGREAYDDLEQQTDDSTVLNFRK